MVSSSRRRRERVSVGGGVSDGGSSTSSLSARSETLTPPSGLVDGGEGGGARQALRKLPSFPRLPSQTHAADAGADAPLGGGTRSDRRRIARHRSWGPGRRAGGWGAAAAGAPARLTDAPADASKDWLADAPAHRPADAPAPAAAFRTFRPVGAVPPSGDDLSGGGCCSAGASAAPRRHSPVGSASGASRVAPCGPPAVVGDGSPTVGPVGPMPPIAARARTRSLALDHRRGVTGRYDVSESDSSVDSLAVPRPVAPVCALSAGSSASATVAAAAASGPLPPTADAMAAEATPRLTAGTYSTTTTIPVIRARHMRSRTKRSSRRLLGGALVADQTDELDGRPRSRSHSGSRSPPPAAGAAALEQRFSSAGHSFSRIFTKPDVPLRRHRSRLAAVELPTDSGASATSGSSLGLWTADSMPSPPPSLGEGAETLAVAAPVAAPLSLWPVGEPEAALPRSPAVPVSETGDDESSWSVPAAKLEAPADSGRVVDGPRQPPSPPALGGSSLPPSPPPPPPRLPPMLADARAPRRRLSTIRMTRRRSMQVATAAASVAAPAATATTAATAEEAAAADAPPMSVGRMHWRAISRSKRHRRMAATFHGSPSSAGGAREAQAAGTATAAVAGASAPARSSGVGGASGGGANQVRTRSLASRAVNKAAGAATSKGGAPARPAPLSTGAAATLPDAGAPPPSRRSLPGTAHQHAGGSTPSAAEAVVGGHVVTPPPTEDDGWNGRGRVGNVPATTAPAPQPHQPSVAVDGVADGTAGLPDANPFAHPSPSREPVALSHGGDGGSSPRRRGAGVGAAGRVASGGRAAAGARGGSRRRGGARRRAAAAALPRISKGGA